MSIADRLDVVRSVIRSSGDRRRATPAAAVRAPVVTISRAAGIDAGPVADAVARRLGETAAGDRRWLVYDRALVERVAADHHLARDLVESFDERDRSWLEHLTAGLAGTDTGADVAMKTAKTIRGVARIGAAVIVGRGGQCVLAGVPGAVHVRLTAPAPWRAARLAEREGLEPAAADRRLADADRTQQKFIHGHYGRDVTDPDLYHAVFNVSRVDEAVVATATAAMVGT